MHNTRGELKKRIRIHPFRKPTYNKNYSIAAVSNDTVPYETVQRMFKSMRPSTG